MENLLLILFLFPLIFSSCKIESNSLNPLETKITTTTTLAPKQTLAPAPTAQDKATEANVRTHTTPAMLNVPHWRMVKFCPKWPLFTMEDKKQFWVDWVLSLSKVEPLGSDYMNTVDYRLKIPREVSQTNANQEFIELMGGRLVNGKYVGGQWAAMRPGPSQLDSVVREMKARKSKCF